MYENLIVKRLSHDSCEVELARKLVVDDITRNGSNEDHHMISWFVDRYWINKPYLFCYLVYDDNELVSISVVTHENDNTLKIFCKFYTIKKYRSRYQAHHHVCILPDIINYATEKNIKGLWYSIHTFNKRLTRYAESQKRLFKGSNIADDFIPYRDKFLYVGNIIYNSVDQEKFYMKIK